MAQGKHIGKVVVSFPEAVRPATRRAAGSSLRGQTGRLLSDHRRVRRLRQSAGRMAGGLRRAAPRAHQPQRRRHAGSGSLRGEAASRGVDVQVVQADVGSPEDVTRLLAEIRTGGQPLGACSISRWSSTTRRSPRSRASACATVMAPKAHGAWLLHEGTRDMKLDCFVMFSSDLQHLRQSGAGKLRRGQCLPRLARAPSPRARPARAYDELGRARRRRLRRAQRARRRIPRAAGHHGRFRPAK